MKNTDKNVPKDLGYRPHENEYLRKKRLERQKTLFTKKNIYRLILMSLLLCGAFVIWAERTGFEGEDVFIATLGFFMMFAGVIALSLVAVVLLMLVRKLRGGKKSSFYDHKNIDDEDGYD